MFALKIIHKEKLSHKKLRELYENEINILKSLNHPNICKYIENFNDSKYYYLILEFCN